MVDNRVRGKAQDRVTIRAQIDEICQSIIIRIGPIPGFSIPTFAGPLYNFDARATLTQSVFDYSAITRYKAAKEVKEVAKAENESAQNQVSDQVARAYLLALRSDAAVGASKASVALAEALLKLATSQKAAGTGMGIEITRAQVQLANEKQRLLVAENQRYQAHETLLRALNLSLGTKLELTERFTFQPAEPVTLEQALESARQFRAELKVREKREEVSRLSYSAVKYERLPSVGGYVDYGTIGLTIPDSRMTRTFAMTLKVPLWDGGRRDARREEALSQYRQEKIRTEDLKQQVELEIRLALDSLRAAEEQAKVAEEGLKLSESELAQASRRYEAGVANSLEVTDAQTRLERARDNRIAALFSHNLAKISLATSMGAIHRIIQ